ncbi:NAD(P)H-dependent oxidoreductase [Leptospira sp. 201903070]|uniref:NAD(P)H-dependent oxidoreductase n=1 Tax=Leptospira ainlahdjerensis TaxID=2810033 RepID=A0ABS2UEM1_9LEPT|nr:NAD(P)H-dependent oxidoreductase [Leptospira ainlahdjerensis]MBM9578604.1 NAD(P)H-dependent oxidoreductase [Leptospira ainlahdjerensis]
MKFLLVYCHSNPKSFTKAILDAISETLESLNHSVKIIDLYAEKFDPVLQVDEAHRRRDLYKDPSMASYRELILEADHLVFIYPVWWHGFPAILKGFIDRVITSDFVYSFKDRPRNSIFPQGYMSQKKISCFYTLDAPFLIALIDPGWLAIKYGIFRFCGFRNVERYYRHNLKHATDLERSHWIEECRKIANFL